MAQFRAEIKGNRESVSRLGSKNSGIETVCNGWNSGVTIEGRVDALGNDRFDIIVTGGSNAENTRMWIGHVYTDDSGKVFFESFVEDKKEL